MEETDGVRIQFLKILTKKLYLRFLSSAFVLLL